MAITLPTFIEQERAKQFLKPAWLVEVDERFRYCSGTTITWNGREWVEAGIDIRKVSQEAAELAISDKLLTFTLGGLHETRVRIFKGYFADDWSAYPPHYEKAVFYQLHPIEENPKPFKFDFYIVFDGYGDSFDLTNPEFPVIRARFLSNAAWSFPDKRINADNGFNFLPTPGQIIQWGSTTIHVSAN